ncbi:MAG: hypothetical protein HW380_284, partial [Magnetococcales bacterium]|nr:hypothetical protein [Magnetococcales bacterium]
GGLPPPNLRRGENLPPDPRNTFKEKKAGGLNGYKTAYRQN